MLLQVMIVVAAPTASRTSFFSFCVCSRCFSWSILSWKMGPFASGGASMLQSSGAAEELQGVSLLDLFQDSVEFARDIHDQKRCRRCEKNVPVGGWTYVRLESLVSPLLRPGEVAEGGIQFRCECGAIHLGEALPESQGRGRPWCLADTVVEVAGRTCPVREVRPATRRRG